MFPLKMQVLLGKVFVALQRVLSWDKRDRALYLCVNLSMDVPPPPRIKKGHGLGQGSFLHLRSSLKEARAKDCQQAGVPAV